MIRALYGGSFDPFHEGHLAVVNHLLDHGLCDHVHVVPAGLSPFKHGNEASPDQRLAMARAALAGLPRVSVDDREARADGPSWTVTTLAALAAEHPGDAWRLVMGADAAAGLPRWRDADRLLVLARLIILARRGQPVPDWAENVHAVVLRDFDVPVSATDLRRRLAAGEADGLPVPPAVLRHIRAHGLYGARPDPNGGPPCP